MPEGKDNHQQAVEHHESAAKHYQDAAYHHREAAKHYKTGDNEKAAYHAQMAHGHELLASEYAAAASKVLLGMMRGSVVGVTVERIDSGTVSVEFGVELSEPTPTGKIIKKP
jgi:hypothetical protein